MAYDLNVIHPAELENESRLAKPEINGASTHEMDGAGTHEMDGAATHEMDGASPHGRNDNDIL